MSLLEELSKEKTWQMFYDQKISSWNLRTSEEEELKEFINTKAYRDVTNHICERSFCFAPPEKRIINKISSRKKRAVYVFKRNEVWVLKLICFLLYRYDYKMSRACYSFRKEHTAKMALYSILHIKNLRNKYCIKIDIKNYFNSIPADALASELDNFIDDDDMLLNFLKNLITQNLAYENGKLIEENRGAMAGCPISPFFANIYLKNIDEYFLSTGINYYRYSDVIIFFANTEEDVLHCMDILTEKISEKGLSLNEEKFLMCRPGESWSFLGFAYKNGKIDLADITKEKIKGKIKRKAHALYRWRKRKNITFEKAAKAMIRRFTLKFYNDVNETEFSWSKWFFPVITTPEGLYEVDRYFVKYIRFLYKGRHYKGNFKVTYSDIKKLGFRSLVNEYYKYKISVENAPMQEPN